MQDTDVVVVGGGLAGLATARRLLDAGCDVLVVEARERVGGRVLTTTVDGLPVDLGGTWIGPGQERMAALAADLGLQTFPTYDAGEHLLQLGGPGGRRRTFTGRVPPLPPWVLADIGRAQLALDRMARRVPLDAPWTASKAASWDAQTFDTWIRRNALTADGRRFFRFFAGAVLTTEAANLSLLHTLLYIHSGAGTNSLMSTTGGAQQDRISGGAQGFATGLAGLLGDRVQLSWPVEAVTSGNDHIEVSGRRGTVRARRAVVAVPPALAGRLRYDPPLPGMRDQLTQRLPHGATVKAVAMYGTPFWRAEGLSGQAFTDSGDVLFTYDVSPPDGSRGSLVAFVEGRKALRLGSLDADQRRRRILDSLAGLYGPRAADPQAYVEQDWQAEPYTRGCYGGHAPPGVLAQYGPALRETIGRIHWAGTETARRWNGYMEGAVESGDRAAEEVLSALA